jgi:hypothetical protein
MKLTEDQRYRIIEIIEDEYNRRAKEFNNDSGLSRLETATLTELQDLIKALK